MVECSTAECQHAAWCRLQGLFPEYDEAAAAEQDCRRDIDQVLEQCRGCLRHAGASKAASKAKLYKTTNAESACFFLEIPAALEGTVLILWWGQVRDGG